MHDELSSLTVIFTEFYYWVTVALMFLIHVGFCVYEVAASRWRNHQHTLMKNTMLVPIVTITAWLFACGLHEVAAETPSQTAGVGSVAVEIVDRNLKIHATDKTHGIVGSPVGEFPEAVDRHDSRVF